MKHLWKQTHSTMNKSASNYVHSLSFIAFLMMLFIQPKLVAAFQHIAKQSANGGRASGDAVRRALVEQVHGWRCVFVRLQQGGAGITVTSLRPDQYTSTSLHLNEKKKKSDGLAHIFCRIALKKTYYYRILLYYHFQIHLFGLLGSPRSQRHSWTTPTVDVCSDPVNENYLSLGEITALKWKKNLLLYLK